MATIAVLIEDMFEDVEYSRPAEAFRNAGHELVLIGVKEGQTVTGKRSEISLKIEREAAAVDVDDFDALFIPGGYSPDKLRVHEPVVTFVRNFVQSAKPVFMICHAPQLLITADVLRGRRITGYRSVIQDIKNAGAEFVDDEVVVDGNLTSSRNPGDIPAFIRASLAALSA